MNDEDLVRQEFEDWASAHPRNWKTNRIPADSRHSPGEYWSHTIEAAWQGWKGAKQHQNSTTRALVAALNLIEVDKEGDGFICKEAMQQVSEALNAQ